MPKSAYKTLRASSAKNMHPILFSERARLSTSKQAQEYLLCEECELRLKKQGEDWTLAHCFRGPGEFRMRQLLLNTAPLFADDDIQLYKANDVAGIDLGSIVYFGVSVFWRASVRRWSLPGAPSFSIDLGPYQEPMRGFLLGESGFPGGVTLHVAVSSNEEVAAYFVIPMSGNDGPNRCHYHKFSIPGMQFLLFAGGGMPQDYLNASTAPSAEPLITVYPHGERMEIADLAKIAQEWNHRVTR